MYPDSFFFDVLWLHGKWKIYKQMFIETDSKLVIENSGLKPIFRIFQSSLIQDIYMGINRLLDREIIMGRRNISFDTLISETKLRNEDISITLDAKLNNIKNKSESIKILRNRKIAHSDFSNTLDLDKVEIIKPKIQLIDEILADIADLMNIFIVQFEKRPAIAFGKFKMSQDGMSIIEKLRVLNKSPNK